MVLRDKHPPPSFYGVVGHTPPSPFFFLAISTVISYPGRLDPVPVLGLPATLDFFETLMRACGEERKLEETGREIICGALTTLVVKGLMVMMMMILSLIHI